MTAPHEPKTSPPATAARKHGRAPPGLRRARVFEGGVAARLAGRGRHVEALVAVPALEGTQVDEARVVGGRGHACRGQWWGWG